MMISEKGTCPNNRVLEAQELKTVFNLGVKLAKKLILKIKLPSH